MKNSIERDIHLLESYAGMTHKMTDNQGRPKLDQAIERVLLDYKRILKENETYKKQYFCLIDKIENKIDKFDYEFEKAKRKNYQERADYYWDLIINFKKLLESEE